MNFDSSFLAYFINAGLVIKAVLLLLVGASILSWTAILQRAKYLRSVENETSVFEQAFWSGGELSQLYDTLAAPNAAVNGINAIFLAGFKEYMRLSKQVVFSAHAIMENAQRAMRSAQMREHDKLELGLPLLATVGSTSPYVGLFGTVWGIMLSFKALAHVQQATIAMVAPGIAEALVATAIGLFAAIPAVVCYNRFTTAINRLLSRYEAFQEEFANILFRQAQINFAATTTALPKED